MTTLHFEQQTSPAAEFWNRGTGLPLLALVYLLTKVSPTEALKFCAIFNPLATLIWPWNAEFISKLGGKPMHKLPTIVFPLLSLAGLLAL